MNNYKQATEVVMFDKQIVFKTYAKNKTDNLFKFFRKLTKKVNIGKHTFPIAGLELAILESLYNPGMIAQGYINELVKKVIRKYHKTLDIKIREAILKKNKHNGSSDCSPCGCGVTAINQFGQAPSAIAAVESCSLQFCRSRDPSYNYGVLTEVSDLGAQTYFCSRAGGIN